MLKDIGLKQYVDEEYSFWDSSIDFRTKFTFMIGIHRPLPVVSGKQLKYPRHIMYHWEDIGTDDTVWWKIPYKTLKKLEKRFLVDYRYERKAA
mgnify:CR=1 FL=1